MLDLHKRWIEKLAGAVDPAWQAHCRAALRRVFDFLPADEVPFIAETPPEDGEPWPTYEYNDAFDDPEKMLMNQLAMVHAAVRTRDYRPLNMRANYGTVILSSVLGGPWQLTDNSMPWAHPLDGGRDAVRALIDRGPADPRAGLGTRCFETVAYYRQVLDEFPPLAEAIDIYHPDVQGPYDIAHLLMGPDIFLAGYDEPDLVDRLLAVVTETYRRFVLAWADEVGFRDDDGMTTHWGFFIRGRIMLRDDTAILLRPEQYERFVRPFNQRLLEEFGGSIHFCGRGDQVFDPMLSTGGLSGVHASQPELNDHQRLLELAQARRIVLLSWPADMLPAGVRTGILVSARSQDRPTGRVWLADRH